MHQQFDIVNEYCEFPYFIDFAFLNIRVAVELDGKCHFINGEKRKDHDKIKNEYLIEKGWKVFRIGYTENNEKTIHEFLLYIHKLISDQKILENRIYQYKEIKNTKQKSKIEYLKNRKEKLLKENQKLIELIKSSNIDFSKYGWVKKVAILINKHPQKIRLWMEKYMPILLKTAFKRD